MIWIDKLKISSFGKISAIFLAIIGFATGIVSAFFSQAIVESLNIGNISTTPIWIIGLLVFPLTFGILGFILGSLFALIYNIISYFVKGIAFDYSELVSK